MNRALPTLFLAAALLSGCMHYNKQFDESVAACTGKPLACFTQSFGPTEGNLVAQPGRPAVYRFSYFFRELYGDCWGNVVLDPATGFIARGYLDGPGCRYD